MGWALTEWGVTEWAFTGGTPSSRAVTTQSRPTGNPSPGAHLGVPRCQGSISLLLLDPLQRNGSLDAFSWRAHDGKASALAVRWHADAFASGGADGIVRLWSFASIASEAKVAQKGSVARFGGLRGLDLGLCAVAEAVQLATHGDTLTHIALCAEMVASASRDGSVQVAHSILPRHGRTRDAARSEATSHRRGSAHTHAPPTPPWPSDATPPWPQDNSPNPIPNPIPKPNPSHRPNPWHQ